MGNIPTRIVSGALETCLEIKAIFRVKNTDFPRLIGYPNWKGPVAPLESVTSQLKVIDNLTMENSGKFLSYKGTKEWL